MSQLQKALHIHENSISLMSDLSLSKSALYIIPETETFGDIAAGASAAPVSDGQFTLYSVVLFALATSLKSFASTTSEAIGTLVNTGESLQFVAQASETPLLVG